MSLVVEGSKDTEFTDSYIILMLKVHKLRHQIASIELFS